MKIRIYKVTEKLYTVLDTNKKEGAAISLADKGLEHLADVINEIIIK